MKKAYLDANILLAISAGKEKEPDQYRLAEQVFDEIKDGKIQAIISPLTLMEVIGVLRAQKGREKHKLNPITPKQQIGYVLNESKAMYDKLMFEVLQLSNVKFELGKHTDLNKMLDQAFDILQRIEGKVKFRHKCKRCGTDNVTYSLFKGLGSDDVIHALLAKDSNCDILITFDGDFDELKGFEEFEGLEFRVMKW